MVSRSVWEVVGGDGTFVCEFGACRDCLVPFRSPNREVVGGVSGFDEFSVDTTVIMSKEVWTGKQGVHVSPFPFLFVLVFPDFLLLGTDLCRVLAPPSIYITTELRTKSTIS